MALNSQNAIWKIKWSIFQKTKAMQIKMAKLSKSLNSKVYFIYNLGANGIKNKI